MSQKCQLCHRIRKQQHILNQLTHLMAQGIYQSGGVPTRPRSSLSCFETNSSIQVSVRPPIFTLINVQVTLVFSISKLKTKFRDSQEIIGDPQSGWEQQFENTWYIANILNNLINSIINNCISWFCGCLSSYIIKIAHVDRLFCKTFKFFDALLICSSYSPDRGEAGEGPLGDGVLRMDRCMVDMSCTPEGRRPDI